MGKQDRRAGFGVSMTTCMLLQSGFSGEVAQKPPYSRFRSEWTRTGGCSEGGQLFQEVWEELRIQNSIFYRKSDLNEFNQRNLDSLFRYVMSNKAKFR